METMEPVRCPDGCGEPLTLEPYEEDSVKLSGCTCGNIPGCEIPLREMGLQKLEGVTIYLYQLKSN